MAQWIDVTAPENWASLKLTWETPILEGADPDTACYPGDDSSVAQVAAGFTFSGGVWQGPALARSSVVGTDFSGNPATYYTLCEIPFLRYAGTLDPMTVLGVRVTARLRTSLSLVASAIDNQSACFTPAGDIWPLSGTAGGGINRLYLPAGSYPNGTSFTGAALRENYGEGPYRNIAYGFGSVGAELTPLDITAVLLSFGSECTKPVVANTSEDETSAVAGYFQCLDITKIEFLAEPLTGEFWTDFDGTLEVI